MTKLEKMRDELAKKCRLEGKPAFGKYQPGVSWDFCAGFDASTAYHAEIIGELVKALEFYTTGRSNEYVARAALESVRSKI